jgi:hypothetical protein
MMKKLIFSICCFVLIFPIAFFAQKNDSVIPVQQSNHKNVIKFNPTPMILWSWKNVTFSYERILSPRQSISFEMGYLEFPKLINDTVVDLVNITSSEKWGLNATVEYRFYLTKLNTRHIPAGLYLGPYLTYYQYQFKNGLDIFPATVDTTGMINGNFWAFNLGVELGYQFVFWKRLTLDMVLVGPSISYYGGKTEITGNLDGSQIQQINEALYDKLIARFPGITALSSTGMTFQQTGKLDVFRMGFRYLVQLGFHF